MGPEGKKERRMKLIHDVWPDIPHGFAGDTKRRKELGAFKTKEKKQETNQLNS